MFVYVIASFCKNIGWGFSRVSRAEATLALRDFSQLFYVFRFDTHFHKEYLVLPKDLRQFYDSHTLHHYLGDIHQTDDIWVIPISKLMMQNMLIF